MRIRTRSVAKGCALPGTSAPLLASAAMPVAQIAVLDDYQDVARSYGPWESLDAELTVFTDHLDGVDAVAERLAPFDVIVAMRERTPFGAELFARLPRLRLLVTTGMANAAIDLDAATAHGVTVCGTRIMPGPTAGLTWGLILGLLRHIPEESANVRAGGWQTTVGVDLARADARRDRLRPARAAGDGDRARVRDGRDRLEREPRPGRGPRGRRRAGRLRGAPRARGRGEHPHAAQRPHARADRGAGARADEGLRGAREHVARPDRRRGRARGRVAVRHGSAGPRSTSSRPSRSRPTIRCGRRRTRWSRRTSAT